MHPFHLLGLTDRQKDALRYATLKGGAIYVPGSRAGGAIRRMCERLAAMGLVEKHPPFPISEEGRKVVEFYDLDKAPV